LPDHAAKKGSREPPSTVGRGKPKGLVADTSYEHWSDEAVKVWLGDSLSYYAHWPTPTTIISDGGYGVLGFDGDTSDHLALPGWYEPHIEQWALHAAPSTTLWFWNSEIGWAAVHPALEKHGWRYVNANIWDKGKGHIAGNINTRTIRRFPVVTEVCVQYVREARVDGLSLKEWLLREWKRTGLPLRAANQACGVADAAVRKYLDQGHLWYCPPPEMFVKLAAYANQHGRADGRPYFSLDGVHAATEATWADMRAKFHCPHGFTNVWRRSAVRGKERITIAGGKAVHLNQKPLDLIQMIVESSSDPGDVVWEPFGGLFTACVAARNTGRRAYGCEIDPDYFQYAVARLEASAPARAPGPP